jgi:ribosome biogenesis GTPase
MQELDFERLRRIGLTSAVARSLFNLATEESGARVMRVVEVHRETVQLHDGERQHAARLLPKLHRTLADAGDAIAVGDWVFAAPDAHGDLWVAERLPPLTALARRDGDGRRHVVVSNVDTALLVMGLDADFNPRRLERFLAVVSGSGVWPVVVLSKADLCADVPAALAQLRERLPQGVAVHALDTQAASAADELAPYLAAGQTVVLLGSSGAGKSTLTNTLLGHAMQDTGPVRAGDSRGRHTTTSRSLHLLPGGACVIDTPGVRALRPDGDEQVLDAAFADIAALAAHCRFRDCGHQGEPGCAVRAGVPADRLRNFHKLQRELRRDTMTALERREEVSLWKARGRAARVHMKAKRGE